MLTLCRFLPRLRDDRRGVSLIEFAIVAPVLILTMLGMIDVAPALVAKFKVNHAAETTGDVATSYNELRVGDMANAYAAAGQVMSPLPSTTLVMRVTNVFSDGNGNAKVYWSCGQGALPALTALSTVTTTPTGNSIDSLVLRTKSASGDGTNTSFLMVESQYAYSPITKVILPVGFLMTNTVYIMPRISSYVGFPWNGNSANDPPVPNTTTTVNSTTLSNGAVCSYAT